MTSLSKDTLPFQRLIGEDAGVMQRVQTSRKGVFILSVTVIFLLALVTRWSPHPQLLTLHSVPAPINEIASGVEDVDDGKSENSMLSSGADWNYGQPEIGVKFTQIAQPNPEVVNVKTSSEAPDPSPPEDPDASYKIVSSIWTHRCDASRGCIRDQLRENETALEPEVCWLNCGTHGSLWPYPTGKTNLGQCLTKFSGNKLKLTTISFVSNKESKSTQLLNEMWNIFAERLNKSIDASLKRSQLMELENTVNVNIFVEEDTAKISLDTNESFNIRISSPQIPPNTPNCDSGQKVEIEVQITALTIFGARHALETLLQLLTFDKTQKCFQILNNVEIDDAPVFPYRGILIDSARNFIPVDDLKRMIDGMSMSKLNILHWHLTDTNSFPFYSKRVPKMTMWGAYSADKVYYPNDVQDLVNYALIRGVKIVCELDAPAHAGNGWQWGPSEGLGDLALCVNEPNWRTYCGQPPCGFLNPLNENTFVVLEKLYQDFMDVFDDDLFHMGGDEVYPYCWQSDENVSKWPQNGSNFNYLKLWGVFQEEALVRLKRTSFNGKAIVWTSGLTASTDGRKFLNSSSYIIQVWDGSRRLIHDLLQANYQLIMSNIEAAYLDQGAGTWLGQEHIYPYRIWQKFYDNRLPLLIPNFQQDLSKKPSERQLLGGEATLWSEKVNSHNMDAKTWPRGAAMAENLWSNPTSRSALVYSRLNHHNRRLIAFGIHSDQLQPESCYLISGHCDDPNNPI